MQAVPTDDNDGLEAQTLFTTNSITAAFKACEPRKACGPDRLGNDWYIHYSPKIIPLMLKLYRLWYNEHVCPKSFLETDNSGLRRQATIVTRSTTDPYHY